MKIKNLFFIGFAATSLFVACEEKEDEISGNPSIELSVNTLEFEQAADSETITLTANRDWVVEVPSSASSWLTVSPTSGSASDESQTITISVEENTEVDRSVTLEFKASLVSAKLVVSQAGPSGSVEDTYIYYNNFDKATATQDDSHWPYLDQAEDVWQNQTGSGIAAVSYESKGVDVRANQPSNSDYSNYKDQASGGNNIFFGSRPYFQLKNIALNPEISNYSLSFGTNKYNGDNADNTVTSKIFHVYVSNDGNKWVQLDYSYASGSAPSGTWDLASTVFTVPAGTETLYLYFQADINSGIRIDDLTLATSSTAGTQIDFSTGGPVLGDEEVEGTTTIADFLAAEENNRVWYQLTGTITDIVSDDYGNFDIKDATGEVYIYGLTSEKQSNNDKSFSTIGLKVGDEVTLRTLRTSHNNTPQGGGTPPAYFVSKSSGFAVSVSEVTIPAEGGNATFEVSGDVEWTATCDNPAFEISPSNGNSDATVTITKNSANDTEEAITGKITVTTTADVAVKSYEIIVTQVAPAAQDAVTIVLSAAEQPCADFPNTSAGETTTKTYTINGYDWTFSPSDGNKFSWYKDGYILWGKEGAYILLPSVQDKRLSKITILTGKNASTSVMVGVYDEAGNEAVSGGEAIKLAEKNAEFSWTLANTEDGAKYQLRVCSKHNAQLQTLTLLYE